VGNIPLDRWQYRIGKSPAQGAVAVGDFCVETGPGIGCYELSDHSGRNMGVLIGFPIDLTQNCMVERDHTLAFDHTGDHDLFAEQLIETLAGRYLFVSAGQDGVRIYPDSTAMVPCVYDPVAQVAGCSADSLLSDAEYDARFLHDLSQTLDLENFGWFPGGLTAHQGIERLLPNHCLDLNTWTAHRFWPRTELQTAPDPAENVAEIIDLVQRQIRIVQDSGRRVALPLTAGRDTRMLLACARPMKDDIDVVTVAGADSHAMDTIMSAKIAGGVGLNHRLLPRTEASAEERDAYLRRGGHCVSDGNSWYFPSVAPLIDRHIFMGGAGGEIARAFYWQSGDTAETKLTGEQLSGRMGCRHVPDLIDRLSKWIADVPVQDTRKLLDLVYVEQRMGPWSSAQFPCDPNLVRFAPFLTHRCVELMIGLPPGWKRSGQLTDEIVQQGWPELGRYKYNSLGPVQDAAMKARQAISNPSLVTRKLRKLMTK